ncbi:ribokinase [Methylobacterium iners]|uniref:Ribokinase n=1 Tax=Methylobacterium iners TaxID=418707 RepID=A0ABQ4S4L7_9HYPH|nr:ribokinase [Methylobacterium iners]GJD97097.1 Ribokinase [Methylobacterium iners]
MERVRIFVVGSFVVACTVIVPRLPRAGESLSAAAFLVEPGGKGFNLAVAAHRLGVGVDGIFAIGADPFSELAVSAFQRSGLPLSMIRRYDAKTGAGIGFTDETGENCLAVHMGANALLSSSDVEHVATSIAASSLVMAPFEAPDAAILAAFTIARQAGRATLLNPSPYRVLGPHILSLTSILVVNRVEAEQIGAEIAAVDDGETMLVNYRDWANRLMDQGPHTIIVTLGRDGAVAFRREHDACYQPALPVQTVDSIGAGDAFAAGLATAMVEQRAFRECLLRASACGAIATTRFGAFDAFPSASELDHFLSATRDDIGFSCPQYRS